MDKNIFYKPHIESTLEYLENNIDGDLSLRKLSEVSGFSPYHFHRIFHAITGENLHQYILSRRLHLAANKLLYEACDITEIALTHGFSTPSAFARAFKDMFGCTPTQYKIEKERKYPVEFAKITFPEYTYDSNMEQSFSEITIPDLQTLCIGVTGLSESWENPEIEKAYQQIFHWLRENENCKSKGICGITLDTPEVKSLKDCRYYACTIIENSNYAEGLALRTFHTSGKYVCCRMNRSQKDFSDNFFKYMDYLYGYYLQHHNLLPDYRPFVEFYAPDDNGNISISFCVPIKKSKK